MNRRQIEDEQRTKRGCKLAVKKKTEVDVEVDEAAEEAEEADEELPEEITDELAEELAEETADELTDEETVEKTKGTEKIEFLLPRQKYLAAGIHIGMKQHTAQMRPFVYKIRPDGLAVMNLRLIDERVRVAAKFLAHASRILVVSRRSIAHKTVEKFAEIVEGRAIKGRFMPGTLTNPNYEEFYEADVVLVTDPMADHQAVREAVTARKPVVAICDTFNETNDIDIIIPANNKGAKSLATLFWLLGREILKERGKIKSDEEYTYKVSDFLKEIEHKREETPREQPRGRRGRQMQRGRLTQRSRPAQRDRGRESIGRRSRKRTKTAT